jgi:hypothetical protein
MSTRQKCIAAVVVLLGVFSVSADLFATSTLVTDDFNRRAGYNSRGEVGSPGVWTNGFTGSGSQWGIVDGEASANLGTGSVGLLVNKAVGTVSGNGNSFVLSADVKALADTGWTGVIFNYTDKNNYYCFRYKCGANNWVVQAVKNGEVSRLGNAGTASVIFQNNTYYTLTVSSENLYEFDVSIKEYLSGTVLVSDFRIGVRATEQLSGGYGGLYQSGIRGKDRVRFDNFSLEVIPEPATIGMLAPVENRRSSQGRISY